MSFRNTQPFKIRKDSKLNNLKVDSIKADNLEVNNLEVNNLFASNTGFVETGNLPIIFNPLMTGVASSTLNSLATLVTRNANIVTVSGRISLTFVPGPVGPGPILIDVYYPLPLKAGTSLAGTAGTSGQFLGQSAIQDNAGISFRFEVFLASTDPIVQQYVVTYETV